MNDITCIGMDTSKSVFQLHGVNGAGEVVLRRKLRRGQVLEFFAKLPPIRVGLEACAASHYWGRELQALGHEPRLVPPQHSKPFVGRNKNDAADAEAICEAMARPRLEKRLVPVKSAEEQADLMLMALRERLIARRTQVSNAIRGHAAEFGLIAAKGLCRIEPLLMRIAEDASVPDLAREMFAEMGQEYGELKARLSRIEARLKAWHKGNELSRRLAEVPCIGPIVAVGLAMKVVKPEAFRSGRDFAAWLGLTPRDHSTAGKQRLGVITRAGDEDLRRLLVVGAMAVIQQRGRQRGRAASPWLMGLIGRKPAKLAAVALANKTARIAWKLMTSGERYDPHRAGGAKEGAALLEGGARRPSAFARPPARTQHEPLAITG